MPLSHVRRVFCRIPSAFLQMQEETLLDRLHQWGSRAGMQSHRTRALDRQQIVSRAKRKPSMTDEPFCFDYFYHNVDVDVYAQATLCSHEMKPLQSFPTSVHGLFGDFPRNDQCLVPTLSCRSGELRTPERDLAPALPTYLGHRAPSAKLSQPSKVPFYFSSFFPGPRFLILDTRPPFEWRRMLRSLHAS
jgi:hypothetical protein